MFAHIRLLHGFPEPLWYEIPGALSSSITSGSIVRIPFRTGTTTGLVLSTHHQLPRSCTFAVKTIEGLEPFPADAHYTHFISMLSTYYQVEPVSLIKRIRHFLVEKELDNDLPHITPETSVRTEITLTDEQAAVANAVAPYVASPAYQPFVLHGITGSGKTEVYINLMMEAVAHNKTVIFLVPEVTLALQMEQIIRPKLAAHVPLYSFHSATSPKNKQRVWQLLVTGTPLVIIGVHMPMLLPIANLGLIIIDEEHEVGYQEKKHPKINTREAALMRAQHYAIPILLGSATPSVSSLYNVTTRGWKMYHLTKRFSGALPTIKTVLLTDKKQRRNFWFSTALEHAIAQRLARKEQVIIFINRRGYSFFVQCKDCSHIFTCSQCSVSLTLHENDQLSCHYCGSSQLMPASCPTCKEKNFLKKGIGTQQAVTILQQLFPQARIGRADLDVTAKKKVWQKTLADFHDGTIDILVGTQTITKGFHFPRVTLVGILWADLNIHFPRYNAAETTLQQLIQVAGRAGRATAESTVIVQCMMEHDIFSYLNEIDYPAFFEKELQSRQEVGYPPCARLVEIEMKNAQEPLLEAESQALVFHLNEHASSAGAPITILGPAKPPVHTIQNVHARKIYVKSSSMGAILTLYKTLDLSAYTSSIFFTPNPVQ